MISSSKVNKGINISLHVLILFIFLTLLFFTFISKQEENSIRNELKSLINKNTPFILDKIKKTEEISNIKFNLTNLTKYSKNLIKKYPHGDLKQKINNNKLLFKSIYISCIIFVLWICGVLFFRYYLKIDIHLKKIIIENIIIFIFIIIIEFLFFTQVALKYIPVTSSDLINNVFDRIQENINKELII